jgi:hypothetical protein
MQRSQEISEARPFPRYPRAVALFCIFTGLNPEVKTKELKKAHTRIDRQESRHQNFFLAYVDRLQYIFAESRAIEQSSQVLHFASFRTNRPYS